MQISGEMGQISMQFNSHTPGRKVSPHELAAQEADDLLSRPNQTL